MGIEIRGTPLIAGKATGPLLVSHEPLSFWGGYDYKTGTIIDQRHPLAGERAGGRILALPFTRGSSSTTAVLLDVSDHPNAIYLGNPKITGIGCAEQPHLLIGNHL